MQRFLRRSLPPTLALLACIGVARAQAPSTLFRLLPPSETGITFSNYINETDVYNGINYTNAYNGNGVAVGDVDGDGRPDIFFTGTQVSNRLYLNKGDFKFEDVTYKSGVADSASIGRGCVMVDIDGDGDLDIYVCRISFPNKLYINNGDGTFTDKAKEYGLDFSGHSTQVAFFDYDLDGDLDMYLALTGSAITDGYARFGANDRMFRNNGSGKFTDVTKEAGIVDMGYAMNVLATDVNNDGYPDLYVSNDFEAQDMIYLNNRNGTFTNIRNKVMPHMSNSSMGCDAADFNNDGNIDIVTLDMMARDHVREMRLSATFSVLSPIFDSSQVFRNTLQLNRGNGLFSDIAPLAGIDATDWSWPALFADFDQDGRKDLYIGNGMKRDMTDMDASYRMLTSHSRLDMIRLYPSNPIASFMFHNSGDLTFGDSTTAWGFDQKKFTYGAAYADLDGDGDLDMVTNNGDSVAFVYRNYANETHRGNWLRIKLDGDGKNRYGLGARVEIRAGGTYQLLEQMPVRGYLSSVDPIMHMGLGSISTIDELKIRWLGGATQVLRNVPANQLLTLHQRDAAATTALLPPVAAANPVFVPIDSSKRIKYAHVEETYDDLKRERLLPHRLSENGPGLAVGDINGDGLEDMYVGGAASHCGHVLLQTANGTFVRSNDTSSFQADSAAEDMGAIFFDADGDGDLDLYVVSGGSEFDAGSPDLRDRLYLNNGKGHFVRGADRLPEETSSGSCVVAADYDGDGDLDLFIGWRLVPGRYPLPAQSMILRNDGGRFVDATAQVCPALQHPGMICAALWTDFDNDGRTDLVTAGEWMDIRMFHNTGTTFEQLSNTGIEGHVGWWNSIAAGDFDNDGDMDYIVGNLGLNWRYKASPDSPLKIYATDFDGNGSLDPVLSYYDRAYKKEFPLYTRGRMITHMPSIHAKFNTYAAYSTASMTEIFPKAKLDTAYQAAATDFSTAYIENRGNGKFAIRPLPTMAQISPVFGVAVEDFDGDGNLDALLTGNFYDGPEPMVVRYDASWGLVLKGDGKGAFSALSLDSGGVIVRADTRGVGLVRLGKANATGPRAGTGLCALVINNGGPVDAFVRDVARGGAKLWTLDGKTRATHAIIKMKNGGRRRCEFAIGSGYLTQSTPTIIVTPAMASMTLYNGAKAVRDVSF